jgi:SAM-dependent methyltransferase
MTEIDWSLFDRRYPVENGIVDALPPSLQKQHAVANPSVKTFAAMHEEVMAGRPKADYLHDQTAMADLQMKFYDTGALGFQGMDDSDQASGGVFWWKVKRLGEYDAKLLKGKTILFVGAGNGRLVRFFTSKGFKVVATDISRNMLEVGKKKNESMGINGVTYVAQNAEVRFPFKSGAFDNVYSLCVMNHIVNWDNYLTEKLRCVKSGGVLLERLPNYDLDWFWDKQGVITEGIEIKAQYCKPGTVKAKLKELGMAGRSEVWTHDHQPRIEAISSRGFKPVRDLNQALYEIRSDFEDVLKLRRSDGKGIYTMFKVVK